VAITRADYRRWRRACARAAGQRRDPLRYPRGRLARAAVHGRAWTAAASTSVLWPVAGGRQGGGSVHQL